MLDRYTLDALSVMVNNTAKNEVYQYMPESLLSFCLNPNLRVKLLDHVVTLMVRPMLPL